MKAAAANAAAWKKGLAERAGRGDIAALKKAHDAVVYTPGSRGASRCNVLESLDGPARPGRSAEEDLRDEIQAIVAGLLGLPGVDADPFQSTPGSSSRPCRAGWPTGRASTWSRSCRHRRAALRQNRALPLETVFPRKERQGLMMALNNLLAAPSFESFRAGEPPGHREDAGYPGRPPAPLDRLHRAPLRRGAGCS